MSLWNRCTDSAPPADRQDLPRHPVSSPMHCPAVHRQPDARHGGRTSCGTGGPYQCFRVLSVTSGHRRATRSTSAGPHRVGRSKVMQLAWIRSSMSSQIAAEIVVTGSDQAIVIGVAVVALIALVIAFVLRAGVLAAGKGTPEDAGDLRGRAGRCRGLSGRQFRTLGVFVVIVFVLLFALPATTMGERIGRSIFFLFGAAFSASIGYFGMWLATRANVRVAAAANGDGGREKAMQIAFRTGGAVGLATTGLGLLGASVVVLVYVGGRAKGVGGLRFRRRHAGHVHACRRRHLHQGRRRRRRPGRQGREGHSRGRPAQRRHHRRQRGRQRR